MKINKILVMLALIITSFTYGQRIDPHGFEHPVELIMSDDINAEISNDTTIDIKFYHIDVEILLDQPYISGNVNYKLISLIDGLSSFKLDLDSTYIIDSTSSQVSGITRSGSIITIELFDSSNTGDEINFTIYYQGIPYMPGGYKGLRYETHDNNEVIIASLSTPYLAHSWWPCKDGTEDKSDSTFIDITIKDTIIESIPVIAVSNGLLDTIVTSGNKRTFKWKHYYPIVPYYVMVAISNYEHFQQTFNGNGYSFPIDYYVFESHMESAQEGVSLIPDVIDFYTQIFGPYPFLNEKYGMTQLGYYGAIENQTNTITNSMDTNWFTVSIHELAHMWFADMITCSTWHHGWLNEGFASYAEALYFEYKYDDYHNYMENFEFYNAGTVYLEDVSNPFTVFQPIIYNKGAYVLHMLRGVVGDSAFFDIIYEYSTDTTFMYKQSTTEEYKEICETVSGMNLDYFFDQWIYDERFPMYRYNYNYEDNNVDVVINQIQGIMNWREFFCMPMEIGIEFVDGSDTIFLVFNDEVSGKYSFNVEKEVANVIPDPDNWILKQVTLDTTITVGIGSKSIANYNVYPNPNNGSFIIQSDNSSSANDAVIMLYDIKGKLQFKGLIEFEAGGKYNMVIPELQSGIYILNIVDGLENYQTKLSVVK
jgi:peptidase M1-like protein/type IX secretion system substrate protein